MSQASAETARRVVENAYEALSRQDLDEWLSHSTPDFTISDVPEFPDADVHRGQQGARRWAETNLASLTSWNWAAEEILVNDGSTLVARVLLTGRSSAGVPVEMTLFHVFDLRGDKLAAAQGFLDEAQALKAAGLPADA